MSRRMFYRLGMLAAACGFAVATPLAAQPSLEYNVKAVLLLNFARFIEWPDAAFASAAAPIEICIFAPNPFGDSLNRVLDGETVGRRSVSARDVRTASDGAGCHLLFVPVTAESGAAALLQEGGPYTITVGESSRFENMGGAVNFVLENGRVRFTVNLRPVEARGVRISARMLNLARRVDRVTPEK